MSAEKTVRSYADAFNRADLDALVSHYAASTDYRQPFTPQPLTAPAQIRGFEAAMFAGFSDVRAEIEWMVAEGDTAAAGVKVTATHSADMPLPDGSTLPATGRTLTLRTAEHVRVDGDGKIVAHERYFDSGQMMTQLVPTSSLS